MKIALLIPVTSHSRIYKLDKFPLKEHLMPTFDFPSDFEYKIFLGSDHDDQFYTREDVKTEIQSLYKNVSIHYFSDTRHKPAWVWNHLYQIAWDEQFDYFYQLGDDIQCLTKNSIQKFIMELKKVDDVGVTGPIDMNNKNLLTQSFVSRKHMDIFGFYYPPDFKNWFCDNWIQEVYGNRMSKLDDVQVINDMQHPRYDIDKKTDYMNEVVRDRKILEQYVKLHNNS